MRFTRVQFAIFVVGLGIIFAYYVPWKFTSGDGSHISMGFHSINWHSLILDDRASYRSVSVNVELLTLILVTWCSVVYVFAKTDWSTRKTSENKKSFS